MKRSFDHVVEPDDHRLLDQIGGAVQELARLADRLSFALAEKRDRSPDIADVQRLVVLVENQNWCTSDQHVSSHRSRTVRAV